MITERRWLCRYYLSQNPEVMQKLEKELDEAGLLVTKDRPSPRALQYSDLSQLTYLNWVLKVSPPPSPALLKCLAVQGRSSSLLYNLAPQACCTSSLLKLAVQARSSSLLYKLAPQLHS
jgi:hypothetical protein